MRSRREGKLSPAYAVQWRGVFKHGVAIVPKATVASTAAYGYIAWTLGTEHPAFKQYLIAGGLVLGQLIWTFGAMVPTIKTLAERARRADSLQYTDDVDETDRLVLKWTTLNTIRGIFPLAGTIVGLVALQSLL